MTDIIRIGLDTSKSVFQLRGVDEAEQPLLRKQLRREQAIKRHPGIPTKSSVSCPTQICRDCFRP